MGEKKDLRRENSALRAEAERQKLSRSIADAERNAVLDALAEAGFVKVGGRREQADRIRAARAGVIVLDDVHIVGDAQFSVEQEVVHSLSQGGIPGPISASLKLELVGDPAVLDYLAGYVRTHR